MYYFILLNNRKNLFMRKIKRAKFKSSLFYLLILKTATKTKYLKIQKSPIKKRASESLLFTTKNVHQYDYRDSSIKKDANKIKVVQLKPWPLAIIYLGMFLNKLAFPTNPSFVNLFLLSHLQRTYLKKICKKSKNDDKFQQD